MQLDTIMHTMALHQKPNSIQYNYKLGYAKLGQAKPSQAKTKARTEAKAHAKAQAKADAKAKLSQAKLS